MKYNELFDQLKTKFNENIRSQNLREKKDDFKKGDKVRVIATSKDLGPNFPVKSGDILTVVKFIGFQGPFGAEYELTDGKSNVKLTQDMIKLAESKYTNKVFSLKEGAIKNTLHNIADVLEKFSSKSDLDWEEYWEIAEAIAEDLWKKRTDAVIKTLSSFKYSSSSSDRILLKELLSVALNEEDFDVSSDELTEDINEKNEEQILFEKLDDVEQRKVAVGIVDYLFTHQSSKVPKSELMKTANDVLGVFSKPGRISSTEKFFQAGFVLGKSSFDIEEKPKLFMSGLINQIKSLKHDVYVSRPKPELSEPDTENIETEF